MFQSEVEGRVVDWSLLTKDVPTEHHHDFEYLIGMLDWDANVNPEFAKTNKIFPTPVRPVEEMEADGYRGNVDHVRHAVLFREKTDWCC